MTSHERTGSVHEFIHHRQWVDSQPNPHMYIYTYTCNILQCVTAHIPLFHFTTLSTHKGHQPGTSKTSWIKYTDSNLQTALHLKALMVIWVWSNHLTSQSGACGAPPIIDIIMYIITHLHSSSIDTRPADTVQHQQLPTMPVALVFFSSAVGLTIALLLSTSYGTPCHHETVYIVFGSSGAEVTRKTGVCKCKCICISL